MDTPLGDTLFEISVLIFVSIWIIGWLIFLSIILLKWVFPKYTIYFERFNNYILKPFSLIQKYSLWSIIILFLLRLIVGWLGWEEPLNCIYDE